MNGAKTQGDEPTKLLSEKPNPGSSVFALETANDFPPVRGHPSTSKLTSPDSCVQSVEHNFVVKDSSTFSEQLYHDSDTIENNRSSEAGVSQNLMIDLQETSDNTISDYTSEYDANYGEFATSQCSKIIDRNFKSDEDCSCSSIPQQQGCSDEHNGLGHSKWCVVQINNVYARPGEEISVRFSDGRIVSIPYPEDMVSNSNEIPSSPKWMIVAEPSEQHHPIEATATSSAQTNPNGLVTKLSENAKMQNEHQSSKVKQSKKSHDEKAYSRPCTNMKGASKKKCSEENICNDTAGISSLATKQVRLTKNSENDLNECLETIDEGLNKAHDENDAVKVNVLCNTGFSKSKGTDTCMNQNKSTKATYTVNKIDKLENNMHTGKDEGLRGVAETQCDDTSSENEGPNAQSPVDVENGNDEKVHFGAESRKYTNVEFTNIPIECNKNSQNKEFDTVQFCEHSEIRTGKDATASTRRKVAEGEGQHTQENANEKDRIGNNHQNTEAIDLTVTDAVHAKTNEQRKKTKRNRKKEPLCSERRKSARISEAKERKSSNIMGLYMQRKSGIKPKLGANHQTNKLPVIGEEKARCPYDQVSDLELDSVKKRHRDKMKCVKSSKIFLNEFHSEMVESQKDLHYVAYTLGKSFEYCIDYYYSEYKQSDPYRVLKLKLRENLTECDMCGGRGKLIICDGCKKPFHMKCATPPLTAKPQGEWFCDRCELDSTRRAMFKTILCSTSGKC